MAYKDIREFFQAAEAQGRLRRVKRAVDPAWEPACLARWMYQSLDDAERFGFLFENVTGYSMPLMTAVIGASRQTYALALGVEPDDINARWLNALDNPVAPKSVDAAPCQEVVLTGDDADLDALPIPVWTPGKDAAPYITNVTLTRDLGSGTQNTAVYRTMKLDGRHVAVNLNPGRHGYICASSYWEQGKPAPIAWALGTEPVVPLAAVANLPYGHDEMEVAGGLKGGAIETVAARTIDLQVPAHAEIIIEAELVPGDTSTEGPFGEFAGYMGPVEDKPRARITAITHRRNPVYYGFISQIPPSESTVVQSIGNAAVLMHLLRGEFGDEVVTDLYIDLTFGGLLAHGIIAVDPAEPGQARQIARRAAERSFLKRVTVVNSDIDIRDSFHVDWAMNSRFNPARDTEIIENVFVPANMDPTVRDPKKGSKIICDATAPPGLPELSLPERQYMERALGVWQELSLPAFDIPKRLRLLLDL